MDNEREAPETANAQAEWKATPRFWLTLIGGSVALVTVVVLIVVANSGPTKTPHEQWESDHPREAHCAEIMQGMIYSWMYGDESASEILSPYNGSPATRDAVRDIIVNAVYLVQQTNASLGMDREDDNVHVQADAACNYEEDVNLILYGGR